MYAPEADRRNLLDRLHRSKAVARDAWLERNSPAEATQFVQIKPLAGVGQLVGSEE